MKRMSPWHHAIGALAAVALLLAAPTADAARKSKATTTSSAVSKSKKAAPAGPVDINSASQKELESLPGVGPATAKKIVAGRPYSSVNDLSKAGVPAGTITKISSMVTVGAAPAAAAPRRSTRAEHASPSTSTMAQAPGGGHGMVWVNLETKVFHREGDRWYGRTKNGKYMSEQEAMKAGYREAKTGGKK